MAAMAIAACGANTANLADQPGSPQGPPLIVAPNTGVTFSDDFNPYDPSSVVSSMSMVSLVNEPLVEFDQLDASSAGTHLWLATGYSFGNGGKDLQITIRRDVRFDDGSPFGPEDVAATFRAMENPEADTTGVPPQVSDPTIAGDTVTLHFSSPEYTSASAILGATYMLPARLADQVARDPTMTIAHPIGTGPFMLNHYSSSLITYKPNPYYWGGTPPESEIEVPAVADSPLPALLSSRLDWAYFGTIGGVYDEYVNPDPVTNHIWPAPGNTVTLWFNLNPGNGGATGIGDPQVRRAVSYGVDRYALAWQGEQNQEQPASSSGGLTLPTQSAFLPADGSLTDDLSTSGNVPDAATAAADGLPTGDDVYDILTADGYTPPSGSSFSNGTYGPAEPCTSNDAANCWEKGGQDISFSVYDPTSFPDYWEDAILIAQELQGLGMDVTTQPAQGYGDWDSTLTADPSGWQTTIHWGQSGAMYGATPYAQLEDWLDGSISTTTAHYAGYLDPAAETVLQTYASTDPSETAALDHVVQQLEAIMSTEVPEAPLLYGAIWDEFSSAKYVGWPDQSNPYMNPSPMDPQLPYILMQLKAVGACSLGSWQ
jgi:peptide/nickel transport system substrate-binding protein